MDHSPLIAALSPLVARVRTDVTAVKNSQGIQAWTRQPLTPERLARHLNGGPARGVCPIREGQSVTLVGLLDFDSHGGETNWFAMSTAARHVEQTLEAMGMSPILFRSSGGRGIHMLLMWDTPQDARSVRQMLGQALTACGLRSGAGGVGAGQVEVFPKQDSVKPGGFGNQFILPLAGASVPLEWDDMSEGYLALPREALLDCMWPASEPVAVVVKPVPRETVSAHMPVAGDGGGWRGALAALADTNVGERSLTYDEWRNMVFAVHHETGGSAEGLALVHATSARSHKYAPEFLDTRVWPYVKPGGGITGGTLMRMAAQRCGWAEPLDDSAFPDGGRGEGEEGDAVAVDAEGVPLPSDPDAPPEARARLIAKHLCTDARNAERIARRHGLRLMSVAGSWLAWDNRIWTRNDSTVHRYTSELSSLVLAEAQEWEDKAAAMPNNTKAEQAEVLVVLKVAEALRSWSKKCEMLATLNAAMTLAAKHLSRPAEDLDATPWLLSCLNGTLDLRTRTLQPHRPGDLITKLAPVRWRAHADTGTAYGRWRELVSRIYGGRADVMRFVQRWFGYCLTGETREQVFTIHWGKGSNGKSTVIGAVAGIMGGLAIPAPSGLLSGLGSSERDDTQNASLFGVRMVTGSETEDGAALREAFIKEATGGDKISARYLYKERFSFWPTHKLQVLTNPKPVVKGTDGGIWRRIRLIPYDQVFGSEVAVREGKAQWVADLGLTAELRTEAMREVVFWWAAEGARQWYGESGESGESEGGLGECEAIRLAGEQYRSESDRVGLFVEEHCERGPGLRGVLSGGVGETIYSRYASWCAAGGTRPLSVQKFTVEMSRFGEIGTRKLSPSAEGHRPKVKEIVGLDLLPVD